MILSRKKIVVTLVSRFQPRDEEMKRKSAHHARRWVTSVKIIATVLSVLIQ
jgi:hypothetical protein